jgi:hypothetical protein
MRWLGLLILGGVLAMRCGLGDFDVTESVPAQTIPGGSSAAAQPSAFEMNMAISEKDLPTGSSLVSAVTLSSATFNLTAPAGGNFDFVQSVTLSILSPSDSRLKEAPIATGHPKPGSNKLELSPVGDVDLLPYVHAGAMVRGVATGKAPNVSTTFDGKVVLRVHLF